MKHLLALLSLLFGMPVVSFAAPSSNWPEWRGPNGNGSLEGGSYPVKWETDKVLWKAALPGKGCSTPVIWNRQIFLTAPADGIDAALAFDWSGKKLWQKTFGKENPGSHQNGSGSNASPVTDGKSVFVYFKSGTFAALSLEGNLLWETNLVDAFGPVNMYWDHGNSPVLTDNAVIMVRMHEGESWVAAFDKISGALKWKVPRNFKTSVEGDQCYTTPLVVRQGNTQLLLIWGAEHLTMHDVRNGATLWSCGDFNPEAKPNWPPVASPVLVGDIAVVPYGRADRGMPRLHGIRISEGGKSIPAAQRLWESKETSAFVPTPAGYHDYVYILRDRGELDCVEPLTGKIVWHNAFPKASSNFYASPMIAGGNLYAAREDGVIFVAQIDQGFKFLAENKMGERVIASPVAVSNRLFIRGEQNLFCIAGS